jgi:putative hemolysin
MTKYIDNIKNERIEVRLAKNAEEIVASQRLRYKVFFEEEGVKSLDRGDGIDTSAQILKEHRDFDEFDPYCDHLVAIDRNAGAKPDDYIVGTYRLMRKDGKKRIGKWYSQTEFDVEKFDAAEGEILELGRACVRADHRDRRTMQMMWNALAAYMFDYDIKIMFGCGTFLGTDPGKYKQALSYLYYNCVARGELEITAKGENARPMDLLPESEVDPAAAMNEIPTMIRGYIRAGAKVSNSLWIDWGFNGFDVCIIFEMKDLKDKYLKHYEREVKG